MRQSDAWLYQARSDLDTAKFLFAPGKHGTYCQSIAKCQQCVEKSVKAIVAAVSELGVQFHTISRNHNPILEMRALLGLSRAIDATSIQMIRRTLTDNQMRRIANLCNLAPRFASPTGQFQRNTEYPYEVGGQWTAPAAEDSFSLEEVQESLKLAWTVRQQALRLATGLRLGPDGQ